MSEHQIATHYVAIYQITILQITFLQDHRENNECWLFVQLKGLILMY